MQSAATCPSSSGENTLPVGLCGELSRTSFTRGPAAAAASSSGSKDQSGGCRRTSRGTAPAMDAQAA